MKYAVEMDSDALIYVYTKFHKNWFRHSTVDEGEVIRRQTDSMDIT
jgi:hypothetical protein